MLWKPSNRFQLMDTENYYYLAMFESKLDYNNVLSKGPWVIFGHYLTIQLVIELFDIGCLSLICGCLDSNLRAIGCFLQEKFTSGDQQLDGESG